MRNHAAIYPYELGFVVIVHASGVVWTKHYAHDMQAILDLHRIHLVGDDDSSFMGDFRLPDFFDTDPLEASGFHRSTEIVH